MSSTSHSTIMDANQRVGAHSSGSTLPLFSLLASKQGACQPVSVCAHLFNRLPCRSTPFLDDLLWCRSRCLLTSIVSMCASRSTGSQRCDFARVHVAALSVQGTSTNLREKAKHEYEIVFVPNETGASFSLHPQDGRNELLWL